MYSQEWPCYQNRRSGATRFRMAAWELRQSHGRMDVHTSTNSETWTARLRQRLSSERAGHALTRVPRGSGDVRAPHAVGLLLGWTVPSSGVLARLGHDPCAR